MNNLITIKVNIHEFTYHDDKGYHTVVGYGTVPADHPDVQDALKRKRIERVENQETSGTRRTGGK